MTHSLSIGVLLSSGEQFSPYYGGALARWTYEVYSRTPKRIAATVFGFPTARRDVYPLAHQTSRAWVVSKIFSRVPILQRYEELVWLRALGRRLMRFDIIHIHNRPQWVSELRRFGYKGSIVLHLQNNHLGHWSPQMLNSLAQNVDLVAVCSTFLRDTFFGKSERIAAKTKLIFNGVNTNLFHPNEEYRENKTIFFVGRFHAEKGVLPLVQAYAKILDDHPDAALVVAGTTGFGFHEETSFVREVKRLARTLECEGGGKVYFPGYIHHDRELPGFFQKATVFICPSTFDEPFGLVNAEAMSCATPVVGSDKGGIPEVLGETGLIVRSGDVDDLAEAISMLLSRPGFRADLGREAHKRAVENFDWSVIAEKWSSVLEEIAETH